MSEAVTVVSKPVWQSKTVWMNVITGLAAVLAAPEIVAIIPAAAMPYLLALNVVLNIVFRVWFTDAPIERG